MNEVTTNNTNNTSVETPVIDTITAVAPVAEAVKRGKGRPRKYDYPAKLTCIATGRVVKTNPTQFKKMLEASKLDQATFISQYKCRSARKQERIASETKAVAVAPIATATSGDTTDSTTVEG